jgi:hypothetical protein
MINSDPEELLLKRQLAEKLRRKAEIVEANPLCFYRPHEKQAMFHAAGDKRLRGVFAGNRFGKSTMGTAEDTAWIVGERLWLPKSDPVRTLGIPQGHIRKILVITTDWDKVNEVFTSESEGKLWKFLPRGFIVEKKRNHSGVYEMLRGENGSLIRFETVKSFLSNPQGVESSDWDFIHVDEPCPEPMWTAAARGLIDRGGKAAFTLTPLREPWIFDKFFPRDQMEQLSQGIETEKTWAIRGSTDDNSFLTKEAIEDFMQDLSPEEEDARRHGIPLELTGMVYKEFNTATHLYREKALPAGFRDLSHPPIDWPVTVLIDPHPQTANAALFCAASPWETLYFFDEIFEKCYWTEFVEKILERTARFKNSVKYLADPWIFQDHTTTGVCMARDFRKAGLPVRPASKRREQGILLVKQELRKPNRLKFGEHLRFTIREFQHYVWDEKENKPKDKDDHLMECLYRTIIEKPRYFPMRDSENDRIGELEIPPMRVADLLFNN